MTVLTLGARRAARRHAANGRPSGNGVHAAPRAKGARKDGRRASGAEPAPTRAAEVSSRAAAGARDVFLTVPEAVRRIRAGKMIIVVDDADRENEGDLVCAAEKATPGIVNFMLKLGRGILCAPMSAEWSDRLGLKLMVPRNTAKFGTPFTESVDARRGTTTGTSAFDRARTLKALADPRTRSADLLRPGHIFPLRAVPGGVMRRAGHSEAVPDLCELAGLKPVGALCEILTDEGRMARMPALERFAREQGLGILTIRDL